MGTTHKKTTKESFILWMSNCPESFHPLDMQRFYDFAKNAISHNSKRWFTKSYFEAQIKLHTPLFNQDNIDYFYEILLVCRDYRRRF